jgi:group I intron endonuclease
MNFVYLTTNLINGRQYVGSHNGNKNDSYLGSGDIIESAQKKYGKKNFERKILEITETRKEAFLLEEKYIRLNETHVSQGGYNISWTGGMGSWGGKHSEETKKKLSKITKERLKDKNNHPFYGKHHTIETKEKLKDLYKNKSLEEIHGVKKAAAIKKKISENGVGMLGKKHSIVAKKKMSLARIGKESNAKGIKWTKEQRKNKSESQKGEKAPNFGKKFSEETKRKMSEAAKGRVSNRKGKTLSEETKRKISESLKKKKL